jgi:hypothetical protein
VKVEQMPVVWSKRSSASVLTNWTTIVELDIKVVVFVTETEKHVRAATCGQWEQRSEGKGKVQILQSGYPGFYTA